MAPGIMHKPPALVELNWTGPTGLDSFTHNGGLQGDQSLTTSFSQLVSTPPVTGLPDKSGQFAVLPWTFIKSMVLLQGNVAILSNLQN